MAKFTKNAIVKSFLVLLEKKSFEKITVKDIVDDCGINRKTFYYYFADIYDLAEYVFRSEISKLVENMPHDMPVDESMEIFCDIIEKNRRIIMHCFSLAGNRELEKFFDEILEKMFKARVRSVAGEKSVSDEDIELVARIIVFSFVGSVFVWINSGFKPSEKERLKKACVMIQSSVESMIDNLKSANQ